MRLTKYTGLGSRMKSCAGEEMFWSRASVAGKLENSRTLQCGLWTSVFAANWWPESGESATSETKMSGGSESAAYNASSGPAKACTSSPSWRKNWANVDAKICSSSTTNTRSFADCFEIMMITAPVGLATSQACRLQVLQCEDDTQNRRGHNWQMC